MPRPDKPLTTATPLVDVATITKDRLGRWSETLIEEHATPLVLLGVGHDGKSGQLVVVATENISDAFVIGCLKAAIAHIAGH